MAHPTVIDGKNVLSEISSGGHATVYKVWDEVLETHYAIKVMKPYASDSADRFLTEAKVLAQLKHPNIPTILNFGKTEDNRPFIRMEFIDGKDLGSLISEKGKIPTPIALTIILQVARALQFAHNLEYEIYGEKRKGLIHRDIKPANIIVGKDGIVKLIDFGIVKVDKLSIHTSATSILGTPHYMAPEQLDPPDDDPKLDHRGDIYSLGCVLYECITGECQFDAETITGILRRKQSGKYDISCLNDVPSSIKKIIAISTATSKDTRYATIIHMGEEIEAALAENCSSNRVEDDLKRFIETGEFRGISVKKTPLKKNWIIFSLLILVFVGAVLWRFYFANKVVKNNSENNIKIDITSTIIEKRESEKDIVANKMKRLPVKGNVNSKISQKNSKQIKIHTEHLSSLSLEENALKKESEKVTPVFDMFKMGRYKDVIMHLSSKKSDELSDSMFLILCGSLLEVEPAKLVDHLFSRTVRDGYHHYLRGRYYCLNGKWESARSSFLKTLTMPTIIPCEEENLYFLVNSAFNLYQRTPNISNREFFESQKNEYLIKFCGQSTKNKNCIEVEKMKAL